MLSAEPAQVVRTATVSALQAVFENMPDGVNLLDDDLVVVAFNRRFMELLEYPTERFQIGDTFEKFVRFNVARGDYGPGDTETLVRRRVEEARRFETRDITRVMPNGRVIRIRGKRVPGSGYVTTYSDITGLKQAEQRLRGAVESMNGGFALYDAEDRLVIWNEEFLRLCPNIEKYLVVGESYETLLRSWIKGTKPPGIKGQEEEFIRQRLLERSRSYSESERQLADGRWLLMKESRTPDGGVSQLLTDITQIKKTEAALRESEARFRALFDSAPMHIAIKDRDGRYVLANKSFEEVTNLKEADMKGKTSYDLFSEKTAAFYTAQDREVAKTGQTIQRQIDLENAAGETRAMVATKFPIVNADGAVESVGAIVIDVTEQKRAEKALSESEARFRAILDNAPLAIVLKDVESRYIFVNRQYEEWYGVTNEQLASNNLQETPQSEIARRIAEQDRQVIHGGKSLSSESELPFADGTTQHCWFQKVPLRDKAGKIVGLVGMILDITERKKAEKALLTSQAHLIEAQRIAQIGSWEIDVRTGVAAWSDEIYHMFELDVDSFEPSYKAYLDIVHPDDREAAAEAYRNAARNQSSFRMVHRLQLADGSIKWVQERGEVECDDEGRSLRSHGTVQDVTERIEIEDNLSQALVLAEEASQAKSDFLATMSHELRTPLNAILGFSEVMSKQFFGPIGQEKYVEYAKDIEDSGRYLLELITGVLDISKIEAGEYFLERVFLELDEVVDDCIKLITPSADAKSIHITKDIPKGLQPLFADHRALKQILLNLLSNAVKFTPDCGAVTVRAEISGEFHHVTVSDTGQGIPADAMSYVLEPFKVTQSNPLVNSGEGSGLGLAITNSLVRLHGGVLTIDSGKGKGTTVKVRLPSGTMADRECAS